MENSDAPTYEDNLIERLALSLERSWVTDVTVDQASILELWVLMAPRIPWWLIPG